MLQSFLKCIRTDSKSSGSDVQDAATVDRIEETSSEKKFTTEGVLNIKCVSLASHEMVPSKFEELHFLENVKQAKQLFKKYTTVETNKLIAQGREKRKKGAPADLISALGSDEEIHSVGADCGMFAAVFTAYSRGVARGGFQGFRNPPSHVKEPPLSHF